MKPWGKGADGDVVRGRPRITSPFALGAVVLGLVATLSGLGLLTGALGSEQHFVAARLIDEMPVTAMNQTTAPANNSPTVVVHPKEPRFVVLANRLDAPNFGCALQASGNAGRTWITLQPVPDLPPGAEKCYAPEVAFDRNGSLYYLFVGLRGAGNEPMGAFMVTSSDQGRSFTSPREVLGPLNFGVRMAIDQSEGAKGRIHLVWLHSTSDPPLGGFGSPPNPILAAYSDDGGRSFSEPVQVSDTARERVAAPALAVGPGGRVHVAYYDLQKDAVDYQGLEGPKWEGTWSVVVSTSTDGGRRFGRGVPAERSVVPPERVMLIFTMPPPALAADAERVCVAWTDGRHGDPDVFARCSDEDGRNWTRRRRINDDPSKNGSHQYMPRLSLAPHGRLDVVFYDRRLDPLNIGNDVYYTYSTDGGKNFARNLRLTEDGSDSRIGQEYTIPSAKGLVEFGSRLGLLSSESGALAAWADTRSSQQRTTGQDVFVGRVAAEQRSGTSNWAPGLGVALLGLGIVVGGLVFIRARPRGRHSGAAPQHAEQGLVP